MVELHALREARLRRAVKRLERENGQATLASLRTGRRARWPTACGAPSWRAILTDRIVRRADALETAIARAGRVHFPNRVHAVRVAAKTLRYALEAAEATATARVSRALALLTRVQDLLGDLHDRHVFLQTVAERGAEATPEHAAAFDSVRAYLEAGCRDLHRRDLEERDDLIELCGTTRAAVRPRRRGFLAAAGGQSLSLPRERSRSGRRFACSGARDKFDPLRVHCRLPERVRLELECGARRWIPFQTGLQTEEEHLVSERPSMSRREHQRCGNGLQAIAHERGLLAVGDRIAAERAVPTTGGVCAERVRVVLGSRRAHVRFRHRAGTQFEIPAVFFF